MEIVTFKQLTRDTLIDRFGLLQLRKHELLINWLELSKKQVISDVEQQITVRLQNTLVARNPAWNEFELSEWFIGPLFSLIDFNTPQFSLFAFREISAQVKDYQLIGKPDVMVARGINTPRTPFFCFHEYKCEIDADGHTQSQLLGYVSCTGTKQQRKTYLRHLRYWHGLAFCGFAW